MAQIETIGGGISYTSDVIKLTKQVYILTEGTTSVSPTDVTGSTITSADFVQDAGGITRVTVTWTEMGPGGGGGGGSGGGGSTVELIGGSREIPTEAHPNFKDSVSDAAIKEIKKAIQDGQDPDSALVPTSTTDKARILYKLLLRGQEYYLAPAVSYRETTLEASLPSLKEVATVNSPQRAPAVSGNQNWLLTSINARSVAQPTGAIRYEVTKEWMLSDRNGWDPEKVIYDGT
jgi:hypothetical protein